MYMYLNYYLKFYTERKAEEQQERETRWAEDG